jgi:divinyl protochlorophyllide a 8-vinyl-reductase
MHTDVGARIGPNAIIQTVQVLRDQYGRAEADTLLEQGGQVHLLHELPSTMVDEAEFHTLVRALLEQIGPEQTDQVLYESGQRTADYLLAHRIPRPFQRLVQMPLLPRRVGLHLLLWAISKHAWTFVGSGAFRFAVTNRPTIRVTVTHPSVIPVARFYGGTFAHLVYVLIDQQSSMQIDTSQPPDGSIECVYTLTLHSGKQSKPGNAALSVSLSEKEES